MVSNFTLHYKFLVKNGPPLHITRFATANTLKIARKKANIALLSQKLASSPFEVAICKNSKLVEVVKNLPGITRAYSLVG